MNDLPNLILFERIKPYPSLSRKIYRFMSKSFSTISQIQKSDLRDKGIIMDAYVSHRRHQLNDINMDMLDDETKHDIHCRVMALLLKKATNINNN